MDNTLQKILRKVESVQVGLLRVEQDNKKLLLQARAGSDDELLNCIVSKPDHEGIQLNQVSLIQKDKQDYLYITCKVKEQIRNKEAVIISMEVLRACWFTRKSKGNVRWLQQKYMYEACTPNLEIAS